MSKELGDRVTLLRKCLGITSEKLAEITGSSKSYVGSVENGKVPNISANKLHEIAHALGTNVEYLMGHSSSDSAQDKTFINAYKSMSKTNRWRMREIQKILDQ